MQRMRRRRLSAGIQKLAQYSFTHSILPSGSR